MKKICNWCLHYPVPAEIDNSWLSRGDRKVDKEALDWLGINEDEICRRCCNHIQWITERITQSFLRKYDVMLPLKKVIPYKELPRDMKVLGWCAFLHDHLREHVNGRYFKKRLRRFKEVNFIYDKNMRFN